MQRTVVMQESQAAASRRRLGKSTTGPLVRCTQGLTAALSCLVYRKSPVNYRSGHVVQSFAGGGCLRVGGRAP